jgi:hypothetical protein
MRFFAAVYLLALAGSCLAFNALFSIVLAFHVYREVQFGGWAHVSNAFADVDRSRVVFAVKILVAGLLFLAGGIALLRRNRPPPAER